MSGRISPFFLCITFFLLFMIEETAVQAAGTWTSLTLPQPPGHVTTPVDVAMDNAGNLYVAETIPDNRIQKRDPLGNWSIIAPEGLGLGQVTHPTHLAVGGNGDLYVMDIGSDIYPNSRIQKRNALGQWSVIASARLDADQVSVFNKMAVDREGNLYTIDSSIVRVQKRDLKGQWSVIDLPNSEPGQRSLVSIAAEGAGNIYVAEIFINPDRTNTSSIVKRDQQGNWSTIAMQGSELGQVNGPTCMTVDDGGDLYVVDIDHSALLGIDFGRLQKRDSLGHWSVIFDGRNDSSGMGFSMSLAVDHIGNLYAPDPDRSQIEKLDSQGNWSVITDHDPNPVLGQVYNPQSLAMDSTGNLYVAEANRLQMRDSRGSWSILTDYPTPPIKNSELKTRAIAMDKADNLYVIEEYNGPSNGGLGGRLQRRDPQGNWTVLATRGTGLGQLDRPTGLAVDDDGNLFVADETLLFHPGYTPTVAGSRLQKRDSQGHWSVLVSDNPGLLTGPWGLAVDHDGNLYVGDRYCCSGNANTFNVNGDGRIQKRDSKGNWSLIARYGSDLGQVSDRQGLAVDQAGNLYVADQGSNRIQKRDPQGYWSVIAHGLWDSVPVGNPINSITVDHDNNLYVAYGNGWYRVQKYTVTTETPVPYGDLNVDGRVTLADVIFVLHLALADVSISLPEDWLLRADVSPTLANGSVGNGVVNIQDVIQLLRHVMGLPTAPWM